MTKSEWRNGSIRRGAVLENVLIPFRAVGPWPVLQRPRPRVLLHIHTRDSAVGLREDHSRIAHRGRGKCANEPAIPVEQSKSQTVAQEESARSTAASPMAGKTRGCAPGRRSSVESY